MRDGSSETLGRILHKSDLNCDPEVGSPLITLPFTQSQS